MIARVAPATWPGLRRWSAPEELVEWIYIVLLHPSLFVQEGREEVGMRVNGCSRSGEALPA